MLLTRALYSAFLGGMVTLPALCNVYKSDIGKLCDAEQLSQSSLKANRAQIFTWMEHNVGSSDALILVHELEGKDMHGIAIRLRDESRNAGLTACALADQADMQAKDDDFHTDLVNLCAGNAPTEGGSIARLDILAVDDAERMREMQAWTTTNAKSPDTLAVVAKIAAAARAQRGALLRAEAAKVGVQSCLMAGTLDAPPPSNVPVDLHQVNPNFLVMKVDGPPKTQYAIARAMIQRDTASAINTCYANELTKNPKLTGKVALKLTLDPLGHVTKAVDDGSALKGQLITCMIAPMPQVFLPLNPDQVPTAKKPAKAAPSGEATKSTVTFQMTPSTTGEGWTAAIDPAWVAKVVPKKR